MAGGPTATEPTQQDIGSRVSVRSRTGAVTFVARPGERILHAGLQAGVLLPYECGTGTCGTCRAQVEEGGVRNLWPLAPGAARLGVGEVLTCQCVATSDSVLSLRGDVGQLAADDPYPATLSGKVIAIEYPVPDICVLRLAVPELTRFEPGQFVLLSVDGVTGYRAYSFSGPAPMGIVRLIVKRKPDGAMSDWFFGNCRTGAQVRLFGPLGRATFRPETDGDIALMVGSSGVSVSLSILAAAEEAGHLSSHKADVFFGVRAPEHAFALEELSGFAERWPNTVRISVAYSERSDSDWLVDKFPALHFTEGFVHEVASEFLRDQQARSTTAFVAGPPPMVDACVRELLVRGRFSPARIRYDKFS